MSKCLERLVNTRRLHDLLRNLLTNHTCKPPIVILILVHGGQHTVCWCRRKPDAHASLATTTRCIVRPRTAPVNQCAAQQLKGTSWCSLRVVFSHPGNARIPWGIPCAWCCSCRGGRRRLPLHGAKPAGSFRRVAAAESRMPAFLYTGPLSVPCTLHPQTHPT